MNGTRRKFYLHAEISKIGRLAADFDDAKAGYPLERRLNRLERLVIAYRGHINLRFSNGLLVAYDTADAAVLSACEMQHRCADLPQLGTQKLGLRIGIQLGFVRQRASDKPDNAKEIASRLAAVDDGIVFSNTVLDELSPKLQELATPIDGLAIKLAANTIAWRAEIPTQAFLNEAVWQTNGHTGPYMILNYGTKALELTDENTIISVGREKSNDLVIIDDRVSRNHCWLEMRADCVVLVDNSTNGTCVVPDNGQEFLVKKDVVPLVGSGLLFFGRSCNGERRGSVRYESVRARVAVR